jgi:hypothetical protein
MTQAFNLSQLANKVNSSGQLDVSTGLTGSTPVANGGTGQSTYTNGQILIGNTTGNTLTKATITPGAGISVTNGAGSITIASTVTSGQIQATIFNASGTWTCPAGVTKVKATVIGAGGSTNNNKGGNVGGFGGYACGIYTVTPSTGYSITVGIGVSAGTGGTSAFSSFCSASGGLYDGGADGVGTGGTIVNGSVRYGSGSLSGTNYGYYSTDPFGDPPGIQGGVLIEYIG